MQQAPNPNGLTITPRQHPPKQYSDLNSTTMSSGDFVSSSTFSSTFVFVADVVVVVVVVVAGLASVLSASNNMSLQFPLHVLTTHTLQPTRVVVGFVDVVAVVLVVVVLVRPLSLIAITLTVTEDFELSHIFSKHKRQRITFVVILCRLHGNIIMITMMSDRSLTNDPNRSLSIVEQMRPS